VVRLVAAEVYETSEFSGWRVCGNSFRVVSDRILASLATQYSLALYLLVAGSALTDKVVSEWLADA